MRKPMARGPHVAHQTVFVIPETVHEMKINFVLFERTLEMIKDVHL